MTFNPKFDHQTGRPHANINPSKTTICRSPGHEVCVVAAKAPLCFAPQKPSESDKAVLRFLSHPGENRQNKTKHRKNVSTAQPLRNEVWQTHGSRIHQWNCTCNTSIHNIYIVSLVRQCIDKQIENDCSTQYPKKIS